MTVCVDHAADAGGDDGSEKPAQEEHDSGDKPAEGAGGPPADDGRDDKGGYIDHNCIIDHINVKDIIYECFSYIRIRYTKRYLVFVRKKLYFD